MKVQQAVQKILLTNRIQNRIQRQKKTVHRSILPKNKTHLYKKILHHKKPKQKIISTRQRRRQQQLLLLQLHQKKENQKKRRKNRKKLIQTLKQYLFIFLLSINLSIHQSIFIFI